MLSGCPHDINGIALILLQIIFSNIVLGHLKLNTKYQIYVVFTNKTK